MLIKWNRQRPIPFYWQRGRDLLHNVLRTLRKHSLLGAKPLLSRQLRSHLPLATAYPRVQIHIFLIKWNRQRPIPFYWQRGRDLNPRMLLTLHDFQSCAISQARRPLYDNNSLHYFCLKIKQIK